MKILLGIALISLIVAINAHSLSLNKRAHFPFKIDKVNNDGTATIISPPTRSAEHYLKGSQKSARDSALLVGGSSFGSYFIDLTVGTPPQTLQVVVDTGSTTLVLGSASCMVNYTTNACTLPTQNGINYGYSMNTSSSAKYVSCGTSCYSCTSNGICEAYESYGDGSSGGGYMVQDVVSLTSGLSTNSYIANLVYEYNVYGNPQEITNLNSDGIMGLAYPVIGNNGFPSVFDSLVSAGKVNNIFGLYLEQSEGRLDLGVTDTSSFGSCNTHYTPLQMEEYYNIQVNSLSIAGNTAQFPAGPNTLSIVDSGTTFMLVPDNVYQTLMQGFQDFCSEHSSLTTLCSQTNGMVYLPSGYCTGLNQQDLDDFSSYPEISLTFPSSDGGEFSVSIGGNAYILYQETTQLQGYQYCGSIGIASTGSNSMSLTILGDSFMKGVYTIFDRQNQKIGFCGKTQKKNGKILAIAIGSAVGGFCFCGALVAIAIIVHRRRKHHHYHPLN